MGDVDVIGGGGGGRRMLSESSEPNTESTYPFVNVTYDVLTANFTDADAAKAAVIDLVYSVNGEGNQRLKDELYAMGMKEVLSVLGSRKPSDWSWPPPPNPPPPPLPPPSPPSPPPLMPGAMPPPNATNATNAADAATPAAPAAA